MVDYSFSSNLKRRPTPPGVILEDAFMQPRGISQKALSEATGFSRNHISRIIHGYLRVTPELAYRLAVVLDTSAQFWLNLQNAVDLYDAAQESKRWKPSQVFHNAPI